MTEQSDQQPSIQFPNSTQNINNNSNTNLNDSLQSDLNKSLQNIQQNIDTCLSSLNFNESQQQ